MSVSPTARVYGGKTAEQRARERRQALLDGGIHLFGTVGYAATTVGAVCHRAGVPERYFPESFTGLQDLLGVCYLQICDGVAASVLAQLADAPPDFVSQATVGMRAFVEASVADPRHARIQLLEIVGVSDDLERIRREVLHNFATLAFERLPPVSGNVAYDPQLLAMGLVGATNELLIDHVLGLSTTDLDTLVLHVTALALAIGGMLTSG